MAALKQATARAGMQTAVVSDTEQYRINVNADVDGSVTYLEVRFVVP